MIDRMLHDVGPNDSRQLHESIKQAFVRIQGIHEGMKADEGDIVQSRSRTEATLADLRKRTMLQSLWMVCRQIVSIAQDTKDNKTDIFLEVRRMGERM